MASSLPGSQDGMHLEQISEANLRPVHPLVDHGVLEEEAPPYDQARRLFPGESCHCGDTIVPHHTLYRIS